MPMSGPVLARGALEERTNGGAKSCLQGYNCEGVGKEGGREGGREGRREEGEACKCPMFSFARTLEHGLRLQYMKVGVVSGPDEPTLGRWLRTLDYNCKTRRMSPEAQHNLAQQEAMKEKEGGRREEGEGTCTCRYLHI